VRANSGPSKASGNGGPLGRQRDQSVAFVDDARMFIATEFAPAAASLG
jgi:hypothetical protein